jgi:hypothetical protein
VKTFRFQRFQRTSATLNCGATCLHAPWRATTRELQVAFKVAEALAATDEQKINPLIYPLATLDRGEQVVLVRGATCFLVERVR